MCIVQVKRRYQWYLYLNLIVVSLGTFGCRNGSYQIRINSGYIGQGLLIKIIIPFLSFLVGPREPSASTFRWTTVTRKIYQYFENEIPQLQEDLLLLEFQLEKMQSFHSCQNNWFWSRDGNWMRTTDLNAPILDIQKLH